MAPGKERGGVGWGGGAVGHLGDCQGDRHPTHTPGGGVILAKLPHSQKERDRGEGKIQNRRERKRDKLIWGEGERESVDTKRGRGR